MTQANSSYAIRLYGVSADEASVEWQDKRAGILFLKAVAEGVCPYCGQSLERIEYHGQEYGTCRRDMWGAYRVEGTG